MSEERRLEQYFIKNSYGENRTLKKLPEDAPALRCRNGIFVGRYEEKIEIYRGIPYAVPPVDDHRWRAPVAAPKSNQIQEALFNGKSPIQTRCESERASYYPQGEDCLYLNLWMGDRSSYPQKRPVMVFIHGGSYGWGGTADPLYDGTNFAKAHPEVILITIAYRIGLMGFVDFSCLADGEEYPDAQNLGILDQIEALRWIRENCGAFGGDPENVTIFGESAGGGSVSLLPLIPEAKGLFRRVIAQSGSVVLTYSKEQCLALTKKLVNASGLHSVRELSALSEEELMKLNEELNDYNNFPQRDGRLIPEDAYEPFRNGTTADVDMLIGTNSHESHYWINEVGGIIPFRFSVPVKFENDIKNIKGEARRRIRTFMKTRKVRSFWRMSEFYTEMLFHLPAICQAEEHAKNGGKAYMYLWTIPSARRFLGACHAIELAYIFGNTEDTIYTGAPADPKISRMVQQMWVNFAKNGDPSLPELFWPQYDKKTRSTMLIAKQSRVVQDPKKEVRRLLQPLLKYQISPSYADLDLNVPFVRRTAGIGSILAIGLITGGVAALISLLGSDKK